MRTGGAFGAAILLFGLADAGFAGRPTEPASPAQTGRIHVDCRGSPGPGPDVVFVSGAFGIGADWDLVMTDAAKGGRVCAYDRAGTGASAPRPGGEDVIAIADELDRVLDQLGERRPVILVGHSNGALYAETYAALHPERVAGLLYVNGVGSDDLKEPGLVRSLDRERGYADLAYAGAHLGIAPIAASALVRAMGLFGDAAHRKFESLVSLSGLKVARDEDRAVVPGLALAAALGGSPSRVPTAVVSSGPRVPDAEAQAWRRAEEAPALRARRAYVLEADGASHLSPLAADRAYVLDALAWLRGGSAAAIAETRPGDPAT